MKRAERYAIDAQLFGQREHLRQLTAGLIVDQKLYGDAYASSSAPFDGDEQPEVIEDSIVVEGTRAHHARIIRRTERAERDRNLFPHGFHEEFGNLLAGQNRIRSERSNSEVKWTAGLQNRNDL